MIGCLGNIFCEKALKKLEIDRLWNKRRNLTDLPVGNKEFYRGME